jgi:hypothetical protein
MPEPDLRAMATVLAALGQNGLDDDVACIEALQWAAYKDQLARHVRATPRQTRVRIKANDRA